MKITKEQLGKLVEQVVSDHLKTGPTVKLKKLVSDLEEIGKKGWSPASITVPHQTFKQIMQTLVELQKEVEDLEKRVSDDAWRDNPGMGMERDF